MTLLRPFEVKDNSDLLEIERSCPQGNEKIAEAMDKSPNAVARYDMYDNWKVFVAVEENQTAGWVGWTLKEDPAGKKYGYLTEVIVHPRFQRHGIATELVKKVESDLRENGASYVYCYIFEENTASNAVFSEAGYQKMGITQLQASSVYKKADIAPEFQVRTAEKSEIPQIVELINNYNKDRAHFVPFTLESFMYHLEKIPDYDQDNLWVALSDGKIVACTGLWDLSVIAKVYYAREPASMRILGSVMNFIDHFTRMPKIPAENELFEIYYLTDYAFTPNEDEAMLNLLKRLNNFVLEENRYYLTSLITPDDPLVPVFKKCKPLVENWNIYAKSLDDGTVDLEPLYLDIRDFVM